ncbi:MAG: Uma2 family endonuclease, partial [Phycisphaerae bacterium]|nr:Uma2 family endonuclease [Gemmatimonadaceae bacterium]
MPITAPRYTVNDLDAFPDDGNRYELLDGMLLVTPLAANAHQVVCLRLSAILWQAVGRTGDAHVVSPGCIRVPPSVHLEPDILVYPARF